ncbi:MAG: phosphodiester glycosidase family protein [Gammaproteobacteria bacterium]|nr:phosphodiester glycosidase family protein [Gammaproteobacteria bacterium]
MPRQTKKPRVLSASLVFFSLLFLIGIQRIHAAAGWEKIAPGIEYRDLSPNPLIPWAHVHVFRINLHKQKLDLVTARDLSRPHASVEEMAVHSDALIAINGGFFDTEYRPLGLRIGHKHRYTPIKPISWWGVFYTIRKKPYLAKMSQYSVKNRAVNFAIQSGPRLLVDGKVPQLKPGIAERTALGITQKNQVILLVTEHAAMTTTALANLMKAFPLYCEEALNLDGGSSSQIYANVGRLHLNTRGALGVSDAVIVKAQE